MRRAAAALAATVAAGALMTTGVTAHAEPDHAPLSDVAPQVVGEADTVREANGRMSVFVRGSDRSLWWNRQATPGGGFTGWRSLGGIITSDPVAERNSDGTVAVFARGSDDALWEIRQTAPNGEFGSWRSLGGVITAAPAVGRNLDGSLSILVRGANAERGVWVWKQSAPSSTSGGYTGLGGTMADDSTFGVTNLADGRLTAFYRNKATNQLNVITQTAVNSAAWNAARAFSTTIQASPEAVRGMDGRVSVFAVAGDSNLIAATETGPDDDTYAAPRVVAPGTWQPFTPAVDRQADGRISAFGRGVARLYDVLQTTADSDTYNTEVNIGGAHSSAAAVGMNPNGRLSVFATSSADGQLWVSTQTSPNGAFGAWSVLN